MHLNSTKIKLDTDTKLKILLFRAIFGGDFSPILPWQLLRKRPVARIRATVNISLRPTNKIVAAFFKIFHPLNLRPQICHFISGVSTQIDDIKLNSIKSFLKKIEDITWLTDGVRGHGWRWWQQRWRAGRWQDGGAAAAGSAQVQRRPDGAAVAPTDAAHRTGTGVVVVLLQVQLQKTTISLTSRDPILKY